MISRQNRDSPSCPHFKPLAFYLEQNRRPELIVQHIKTEKTQLQDRQPYEDYKQVAPNNIRSTVKDNIAMSMVLVEQNEELMSKIENICKQIEDEQLKARIFTQNIAKNEKEIARLRQKKEELIQSPQNSLRMQSLNESTIPIKNSPANCTLNNTWINEFLNKEELESLWNAKRQRQSSKLTKAEPKVKCFTIDLSTHLHSAKQKQEKDKTQVKLSFSSVDQKEGKLRNDQPVERNKRSIVSVAQNGKSKTQRVDLKLSINPRSSGCNQGQKSRALNKAISTLRNAKKLKPNPQL